ncbi:MAG: hypothetical protein HQM02_06200 [Magnetococcales bacterium]|nr:hypothetical protein [Magnetococcales bacterium]
MIAFGWQEQLRRAGFKRRRPFHRQIISKLSARQYTVSSLTTIGEKGNLWLD